MASWKNIDPATVPEAGDFSTWKADMQDSGYWSVQQLNEAVGQQVSGRTWAQIAQDLNDYCKGLTVTGIQGAVVTPADLPGLGAGTVGFQIAVAGGVEPADYEGVPFNAIATNPQFNGIFALDLDPVVSPPQDIFRELRVGGKTLKSIDAMYYSAEARWVWFDTGVTFTAGIEAAITIVK